MQNPRPRNSSSPRPSSINQYSAACSSAVAPFTLPTMAGGHRPQGLPVFLVAQTTFPCCKTFEAGLSPWQPAGGKRSPEDQPHLPHQAYHPRDPGAFGQVPSSRQMAPP
jgi:hypothetical protein